MVKKLCASVVLASLVAMTGGSLALAQGQTPAQPKSAFQGAPGSSVVLYSKDSKPLDIETVPVLASLVKQGARLYYMGERSGLFGWLIVKDGQIQMIYATKDGQSLIVGGMVTRDGENVTVEQVKDVGAANKEIGDILSGNARQQGDIARAGTMQDGVASVSGGSVSAVAKPAPGSEKPAFLFPTVPVSPGERLIQDLQAAASVSLGRNEKSEILMVVAPNCPYCKQTWHELASSVADGKVRVRLVPISNDMTSDDTRAAAMLLLAKDPIQTWEKFVDGDKTALAGEPDGTSLRAVFANRALIDKWNIRATPYLVYRSKDGKVKIVQGKPERMAAILNDIAR